MGLILSNEAILLVTGFGMVSVIAVVLITKIQKTSFTFHMMWDVIYGYACEYCSSFLSIHFDGEYVFSREQVTLY